MHQMVEPTLKLVSPREGAYAIFGTGHRPEKVDGPAWARYVQSYFDPAVKVYKSGSNPNKWLKLEIQLTHMLKKARATEKPVYVITGGQRGMDLVMARAALVAQVTHILAIPFEGFDSDFFGWTQWDRKYLANIREVTDKDGVVAVLHDRLKKGDKAGPIFNARNAFMVDLAREAGMPICVALWDGTSGGTGNCVKYAIAGNGKGGKDVSFVIFDPNDLSYRKAGEIYLECSTAGYGKSALIETIPTKENGRMSIESLYQGAKRDGNGKPFAKPKGKRAKKMVLGDHTFSPDMQTEVYEYLWFVWFTRTAEGMDYQAHMAKYDKFVDMYATGAVNSQANVMQKVRDEGLQSLAPNVRSVIEG